MKELAIEQPVEDKDSLENNSLWYRYKVPVWNEKSPESIVVHNIMRTLRSIHGMGRLVYMSNPITSGRRLYDLMIERPNENSHTLLCEAIDLNYNNGLLEMKHFIELRDDTQILYPADLTPVHQKWEQAHFQALWLSIIAEKCTDMYMVDDWEYSNGASEEFTHTIQLRLGLPQHRDLIFYNTKEKEGVERDRMKNIRIWNSYGRRISIEDGIEKMTKALSWIHEHGFEAPKIVRCLETLEWTKQKIAEGFYQ